MAASRGLVTCQNCPHPSATHEPGGDRACRISDCGCRGFYSLEIRNDEALAEEAAGKSVVLVIPDGYEMTVTLTPIGVPEVSGA